MTDQLRFLTPQQIDTIAEQWGTPTYIYSEDILRQQARNALAFAAPYGLTVRYAMKANSNRRIMQIFNDMGIHTDASSGPEVYRALHAGIKPAHILLTSQQLPNDISELARLGVQFNASSLSQLESLGRAMPGGRIGIRINPGTGSGHSNRVSTGGETSSFGIWHEYLDQAIATAKKYNLTIERLHTHIGSGTETSAWQKAAEISLQIIRQLPDATVLNLGGGFKVSRVSREADTDLGAVGNIIGASLRTFAKETGRELHLEIEPGSYLVVGAGSYLTTIHDTVDTGKNGYSFIKIDGGLNDFARSAMYGAQHQLVVVNSLPRKAKEYVVVGRCCESSDQFTPAWHEPEVMEPRSIQQARVGDHLVVEDMGGYCAYMSFGGYNSFGVAPEVLLQSDGSLQEIRRRQTLDDLLELEEATPTKTTQPIVARL